MQNLLNLLPISHGTGDRKVPDSRCSPVVLAVVTGAAQQMVPGFATRNNHPMKATESVRSGSAGVVRLLRSV